MFSVNDLNNEVYRQFEALIYGMGRNYKFMIAFEFGYDDKRKGTRCIE